MINVLKKIHAWIELIKLGNITAIRKEINTFFRGNIIRVLQEEGFFDYLKTPRTVEEIATHFQWTDINFLHELLEVLVEDRTLNEIVNESPKYQTNEPLDTSWVVPRIFDDAMKDLWINHAKFLPKRLSGLYLPFTGGFNLFNWDNILTNKIYEQIRRAAFAFSGALKYRGKFLDVGCGNGYGTAAIWSYYYKKCAFSSKNSKSSIEIIGMDVNQELLRIAKEEFPLHLKKHLTTKDIESALKLEATFPEFAEGSATAIPFDDETFDMVYASQVLHWTDPHTAIKEMLRVTKKGGLIFGTQNFYPQANKFNNLHFKVVKGAHGFFHKKELVNWALEEGAKKVEFATPISLFVIKK